ncbi:MAG TPA: outer membrane beta-barrel protein [Burkholderiales bacterium]|jgi:outer membrane immunogenic protein
MKRLLLVFTVLLGASGAASGQNLTGAYFGASIGTSAATGQWNFPASTSGTDIDAGPGGWVGSLNAGINWQSGNTVFGIEGDVGSGPLKDTSACLLSTFDCKTEIRGLATFRGRLGLVNQTALVYATAGAAGGIIKATMTDNTTGASAERSKGQLGWSAGLGIASPASRGWAWKAEWLHIDLGSADYDIGGTNATIKYKTDILRVGLDYRF